MYCISNVSDFCFGFIIGALVVVLLIATTFYCIGFFFNYEKNKANKSINQDNEQNSEEKGAET